MTLLQLASKDKPCHLTALEKKKNVKGTESMAWPLQLQRFWRWFQQRASENRSAPCWVPLSWRLRVCPWLALPWHSRAVSLRPTGMFFSCHKELNVCFRFSGGIFVVWFRTDLSGVGFHLVSMFFSTESSSAGGGVFFLTVCIHFLETSLSQMKQYFSSIGFKLQSIDPPEVTWKSY